MVSPIHTPVMDLDTEGGNYNFVYCMRFPAGCQIQLHQYGYIHHGSSPGTVYNQFSIHYVGANYGTHVYGTN